MSATPVDRVQVLMAKFEDLAVEAGKSAIAIFENIDGGSPEAIALKQGYNRAFTALESALRSELAGKDAERLIPVATCFRGGVPAFGKATAFRGWLQGEEQLPDGDHTLYAAIQQTKEST